MKYLKLKFLLMFFALALAIPPAWAKTAGFSLASTTTPPIAANTNPATGTITGTQGETWNVTIEGSFTYSAMAGANATGRYWQMGKGSASIDMATFSTSDISGTITSIVVDCAGSINGSTYGQIAVEVDNKTYGGVTQNMPNWSSNVGGEVTFTGSASGTISIKLFPVLNKACFIKSITVTYVDDTPDITITPPETLPFNDEGGVYTVNGSNLPTDGLGVNVSNGFDRYLNNGNNQYYFFPIENGAVENGITTVTYTGRELSATGTITYESGSANQSADLSYRSDVYIVTDNGVTNDWHFERGVKMDYANNTYTGEFTSTNPNTYIVFARKLTESSDIKLWNNRLAFGPSSGGDWVYGTYTSGDLDLYNTNVIKFPEAGTYTITIDATNKTFSIEKAPEPSEPVTYVKVTSTDQLVVGKNYIFVYDTYALGSFSNSVASPVTVTVNNDGTVEAGDDVVAFTLGSIANDNPYSTDVYYSLSLSNGNYLIPTTSTSLNTSDQATYAKWTTIAADGGFGMRSMRSDQKRGVLCQISTHNFGHYAISNLGESYKYALLYVEDDGETPTQTVATPTFDPVGGSYKTPQSVTISCATEEAEIRYTTDGNDPDANSTLYTGPITVNTPNATTTIKAIGVRTDLNSSGIATATYTLPQSVSSLAAANALAPETGSNGVDFFFTGDVVVTYAAGDYIWLRDVGAATGGGLFYRTGTEVTTPGAVLSQNWGASAKQYKGLIEFTNAEGVANSGNTAPYAPFVRTGVALTDAHMNEYIVFNNVRIDSKDDDNKTYTATYVGENREAITYQLYDQFGKSPEVGKTYNITGLVTKYNDIQVYPTYLEEVPQVATPTFSPNGGEFTAAQEVTISCATENAKIYYSLDRENWTEGTTLTVDRSGKVYAKATKANMQDSEVAEATFTINYPAITVTLEPETETYTVGDEAKVKVTVANTVGTATVTYMTGETAETANTPVTPDEDGYITIPTTEAGTVVLKVTASDAYHAEPVIKTGTYTIEPRPYVTAEPTSLDFEAVIGNDPVEKTFTVMADNLKGDITLTMTESNVFTITPATIYKADMTEEGVEVTVTYTPKAATGEDFDEAMITIKSTDAEDVTVTLTGMATLPDPVLTVSTEALEMGTKPTDTFTVTGQNLTENVTVSIKEGSDAGFSVAPTSIEATNGAIENATVTVTYSGTSTTDAIATVVVKSGTASKEVIVSAHVLPTPVIEIDGETLDLGTTGKGTFDLLAEDLRGNITLESDNKNFTVLPTTITPEEAEEGVTITVTYNGDNTESETAHITISTDGIEDIVVTVTAKAETYVDLAAPTFSPKAGTYTEPKEVAIACATPGVTIEYTIDGVTKTYEGPFMVDHNCTVTATAKMGTRTVYTPATAEAQYTINAAAAAEIADNYYYLQNNALSDKYANVAGRRTLNFVGNADEQAGTVFRVETGEGGAVKTLRSQAVDLQGYAKRAMAYVGPVVQMVINKLNDMSGVDDATGTGTILGNEGLEKILAKFNECFDYNLYVEGTEGAYRIYARTPSMQNVVDFYNDPANNSQIKEKLPMLEGYINQVLDKIRAKVVSAGMNGSVIEPFSLVKVWEQMGGQLIKPEGDNVMAFYDQVLTNKEYVWDFAYQTAMIYLNNIKQTETYGSMIPAEYQAYIEKMQRIRPETKYYMIQYGNEPDYVSENNVKIIGNDPSTYWTLTPRENFTVNVPEANKLNDSYYTTLYTDFAYTLPEGVTAYAVTDIDDNDVAQLAELSSPIAAQTPVLLKANAAGTVNVTLTTAAGNTPETNLLEGPDYLVKTYGITSPTVEAIFNLAAAFVPADMLAEYEYLKLRTSGTVNNKYFWNVNDALEKLTDDCVVRSLAVKDGTLAFSEHWTTETNKAFLVSDTKPVIYLEKETLAAPTFSPVPGSYTVNNGESVTITITAEDGATIYYKIGDGEYQRYNDPITASDDMTIVAKAEKDGMIASDEVTAVYVIDNPTVLPDVPAMKGYYQIKNNGNEKYAHVQGRKTLTFTDAPADKAGTVIWLETNEKGQVQSLRSQAADLQRYADRAMSYVPDIVELVADKLKADGEGNLLGHEGLEKIMEKFKASFDHHLYVEQAEGGYRLYGKTPSMQPVVEFYRENQAKVEAKLPMLEQFINNALDKLKEKLGGQSVFTPFSLHQIWENMGGNLPEPVVGNDAAIMDFYRAVLNNKNYVWDFAYQTAMIYVNNLTSHPRWEEVEGYLGEYAQYINMIEQVRPDFKYYVVQKNDKPDFISEGNTDIINNADRTIWTVEPRTTFTVNIAGEMFGCPLATNGVGGYFTTNYTDFAYTLPEGVTAYKVTGVNDEGEATLEALSGTIPAQTPVLLVAKEDGDYTLILSTEAGTPVENNLLVGPDYLINKYDFKTEQVQSIFDMIKQKLGEDFYNAYVAQYEYLADLNSGTVNNKYFWSVDNYLDNLQGDCVVRSLATNENGELAFSEHWKTETNKAFLVSDTFDVITLPSLERGDVNHDGFVNLLDVTDLIDRLLVIPDAEHLKACPYCSDVDGNGSVNIKDVTVLIDILLENPATEPEGGDGN